MNSSSVKKKNKQYSKNNEQNSKNNDKITKKMIREENEELDKVTKILLNSLDNLPEGFRKKILKKKLEDICKNIKKKNKKLLYTKSSNKIGGGREKDIRDISNEAHDIITNRLFPSTANNIPNELAVVNRTVAEDFVHEVSNNNNNNITVQRGDTTLTQNTLNQLHINSGVRDLTILALHSQDLDIRHRAFDALVGGTINENSRQRERRYLANTVFFITFIGGIVMSYQVWRVFSVITNVTGDINDLTAPTPAPTPGWGDYVSGIFSGPTPAPVEQEPPRQQSWWEWIGSGGRFGLNRLFYVMHVVTSFLHELIFVSQIGATMATFIFTTFVSIALWHVMDDGFNITTFGFSFSTGRQPHRLQLQQQQEPALMNQRQQPQQPQRVFMNQRQQQQQQQQQRLQQQQQPQQAQPVLMNESSTQSQRDRTSTGGKKIRRKRKRKTHKKKSKKRRKTYKKKNKRKTKKNKNKKKSRRRKRTKKRNKK